MRMHKTQHYLKEPLGGDAGDVCKFCNKASPTTKLQTNPYKREIHDDHTTYLMCDDCANESSQDI